MQPSGIEIPTIDANYFFYLIDHLVGGSQDPYAILIYKSLYGTFTISSAIVSLILAAGVAYTLFKISQIRAEESRELLAASAASSRETGELAAKIIKPGSSKWQIVLKHLNSENDGDWRLAILEADIMLDDLLKDLELSGDNLGERLKSISPGTYRSIDKAWEAHKIRNAIAHEGANFNLNQREARRIVNLFEEFFQELNYI